MKLERRLLHLKATGLPSKSMNSVTGFNGFDYAHHHKERNKVTGFTGFIS